jgi:hypothetical protein
MSRLSTPPVSGRVSRAQLSAISVLNNRRPELRHLGRVPAREDGGCIAVRGDRSEARGGSLRRRSAQNLRRARAARAGQHQGRGDQSLSLRPGDQQDLGDGGALRRLCENIGAVSRATPSPFRHRCRDRLLGGSPLALARILC